MRCTTAAQSFGDRLPAIQVGRRRVRHSAAVHLPRPLPRLHLASAALLVVGAVGLSVWQAQLSRQSPEAQWIVGSLAVAALGSAAVLGRRRQLWTTRRWAGRTWRFMRSWRTQPPATVISVIAWTVLIAGTVGWDLASFACQSHTLPTLSYFIGHITRYRVGRGLVFALWLSIGAYLVAGRRVRARR